MGASYTLALAKVSDVDGDSFSVLVQYFEKGSPGSLPTWATYDSGANQIIFNPTEESTVGD